ncbi:hypothetical protein ACFFS2_18255 [Streptomyces aurantiacus]|uniref:Uncharacterized protein n=1 Tax=Streptomyces aurantiacus TaxID=47760 RepID=A0A7G1NZY1_9ACTN|nr:hypothetical protein [Streptomyces aurantiacus]BCL27117.1 hypothetical protein GCM10017557_19760 [Streptomyces aurantiacus]
MLATAAVRQQSRTLVIATAAVPLALAVLADDVRVWRQLHTARRDALIAAIGRRLSAWAASRSGMAARLVAREVYRHLTSAPSTSSAT